MKCIVCGKKYEKDRCPVCNFPKIEFLTDPEEGLQAMKPEIDAYRDNFLSQVSIGITAYQWKDNNGEIVMDRSERIHIGTGKELRGNTKWLAEKFGRIPDEEKLQVSLSIQVNGKVEEQSVNIPNLLEPELQELGAAVDDALNIQLLLRNSSGSTQSERIPLFR